MGLGAFYSSRTLRPVGRYVGGMLGPPRGWLANRSCSALGQLAARWVPWLDKSIGRTWSVATGHGLGWLGDQPGSGDIDRTCWTGDRDGIAWGRPASYP